MISPPGKTPRKGNDMRFMDLNEFVEKGYLQEVNRQFLHPLGLALVAAGSGDRIEGVWDSRDDPEGIVFAEIDWDKVGSIKDEQERRRGPREAALGYWVQDEG